MLPSSFGLSLDCYEVQVAIDADDKELLRQTMSLVEQYSQECALLLVGYYRDRPEEDRNREQIRKWLTLASTYIGGQYFRDYQLLLYYRVSEGVADNREKVTLRNMDPEMYKAATKEFNEKRNEKRKSGTLFFQQADRIDPTTGASLDLDENKNGAESKDIVRDENDGVLNKAGAASTDHDPKMPESAEPKALQSRVAPAIQRIGQRADKPPSTPAAENRPSGTEVSKPNPRPATVDRRHDVQRNDEGVPKVRVIQVVGLAWAATMFGIGVYLKLKVS